MKVVGSLIIMCLLIIGFNFAAAMYGSMNGAYNPGHAERMAQFTIILIPLAIVWAVMYGLKRMTAAYRNSREQ